MTPRLIVPGVCLTGRLRLSDEDRRHIFQSLRLRENDRIILCDGNGLEALCVLVSKDEADVLDLFPSSGEPAVAVHLYPSLSKGDRFEWMLQKAVELGASSITPVLSRRCVVGAPSSGRQERFHKILRSAAEQSGRGCIPELRKTLSFNDSINSAQGEKLFCYEFEQNLTLKASLQKNKAEFSVMTGPEGGYSPEEAESARGSGWQSVSLGKTVLRCETAPLMVLAAIRFQSMM